LYHIGASFRFRAQSGTSRRLALSAVWEFAPFGTFALFGTSRR
jgi:hypothetical protein